jgi:hypothetical protein
MTGFAEVSPEMGIQEMVLPNEIKLEHKANLLD